MNGRTVVSRQFILFLLAGGLAALANFGSRILLSHYLHYVAAIAIAYCIGMATAFVLNRLFVFDSSRNAIHQQAAWFVVVNVAALLQTLAVSITLARWLLPMMGVHAHTETIAHAVGVAVPIATSYFGHKKLSFRN